MKRTIPFAAALFVALPTSLIGQPQVVTQYDSFDQVTTIKLKEGNSLRHVELQYDLTLFDISPGRSISNKGTIDYVTVSYLGDEWIFIRRIGESLSFRIDANRFDLLPVDTRREVTATARVLETAIYPLGPDLKDAFKNARNVSFRLYGESGQITGDFDAWAITAFQEWLKAIGE